MKESKATTGARGRRSRPKRVVIISDLHCGHQVGLTHPDFNPECRSGFLGQLSELRATLYGFYREQLKLLQPIDVLIVNGDMIDGKGERSGGTEQLVADRGEQAEMAALAIEEAKAGAVYCSYGTPSHVGKEEDWEDRVAADVKAKKIGSHDWLSVNGLVFDYKHFCPSSGVPHARHTAVARERLWNVLWAEHGETPKSDVIVRSHVHFFDFCGAYGWLGMTTPALQGKGTKYGARGCSGTVDFGLVSFDVVSREEYSWRARILKGSPVALLVA